MDGRVLVLGGMFLTWLLLYALHVLRPDARKTMLGIPSLLLFLGAGGWLLVWLRTGSLLQSIISTYLIGFGLFGFIIFFWLVYARRMKLK